ncbi:MAG TPA: PVC-type heme-binding CxxCH protein [Gemmataceae bacterium]|nr:PVC-type heme-binding CxxCH protein [Gemmataceae bacterium]
MRIVRLAALVFVLALVATACLGQPPFGGPFGRGGNSAMLLRQESIQKELKLTSDQIKKVEELSDNMRDKMRDLFGLEEPERTKMTQELNQETEAAIQAVLKPEQGKRLQQITYQRQGIQALVSPEVVRALGLTSAQQAEIRKLTEANGAAPRRQFGGGFPDDSQRKKMEDARKATETKILQLLTAAQQAKWKELQGEPFRGDLGFGALGGAQRRRAPAVLDPAIHDPANAVANLEVHPGLQATLFASEPNITNPTNLDIDHRGRIWICDVVNYRGNNGKRPQGDRILILEDTDGDGKADKVKVFYQGRDIDSAMGICVLGNKAIVSASPNVFVFTFDEQTDQILKKEVLFTKTGRTQHDHTAHAFFFGPDGKLYWNFGNEGKAVHDKDGKPVVDRAGNKVVDNGKPYFGGMVFRCNLDGSAFEVLAHNFRNNYEETVDSFGTIWQSDNDDDGNRGVRINYVMEFGNYGYRDEMTGASWQARRTNRETEIPRRHWHQNDPGVVPNLLQTGAGSPCGICVYESDLLPPIFRNQVIHCDAGPSVVRAYPVTNDGAGYKADIVNILDGQKKNNWFRPVDVCVAPDGSLFVVDWYDPGVGGHQQRDSDRGRIFRVAPPGNKYRTPTFDFHTAQGASEALKNPNLAVRYLAWTALHDMQAKAEPALLTLWESENPRIRARALWLLGKMDGKGQHYVNLALKDRDPDIRITGIRLARQVGLDLGSVIENVVRDPSPQVRRDAAIALRFLASPRAAELWAELANQHDGKDRWYLEALGIGADLHWDACFDAWLKLVGQKWNTPMGRDIVWRSRSAKTSDYLARIISDRSLASTELPRFFRAFDFQKAESNEDALLRLVALEEKDPSRQQLIIAESASRLSKADLASNARYAAAVDRLLDHVRGTMQFVDLVDKLGLAPRYPELVALAQKNAEAQLGVNAILALLAKKQIALIDRGLHDKDVAVAVNTAKVLGTAADARSVSLLVGIVKDNQQPAELRRQAVRSLARTQPGAHAILTLAEEKQLSEDLKAVAGFALQTANFADVREQAAKLFALAPAKNDEPLPAISDLVKLRGDAVRGKELFVTAGTCANCHMVNGVGKEVGPDLSEIGKKLAREAMVEAILFPSAGISHNYESYLLEAKNGTVMTGILVSQTPEEVTLKGADAIVRTFKRSEIETLRQSPVSLMPADLHKALTVQGIADVVEYLLTLKEATKATK